MPASPGNGCAAIRAMWRPGTVLEGLRPPERRYFLCRQMRRHGRGASTFAECPDRPAPAARLLWRAAFDPHVLRVRAEPTAPDDPEALDLTRLGHQATLARDDDGREYLALSNGWHRVRLDVIEGSICASRQVRLHYQLSGFTGLEPRLRALRQLLALQRDDGFDPSLFPRLPRMAQRLEALRVSDALADGASYRDVAIALFGIERVREEWGGRSDFLLSRVRRRVAEARRMASGEYRHLLLP